MSQPSSYARDRQWDRLASQREPWDVAVIGGGATGVGIAIDAATRGYRVVLCEQHDFGKGTSSRSTKLVHGGVRYLKQGHIGLVKSALHERGLLQKNAPHLVHPLPNIVPIYRAWEGPYYALGMRVYDRLSGKLSLGRSKWLSAAQTIQRIPSIEQRRLRGGVLYWDAQFDDARLLMNMVQTAIDCGATCISYAPVRELVKRTGRVEGCVVEDSESGETARVHARVVVNATGPFSDAIRRLDSPHAAPAIATSQGVHIMLDRSFLPGETALMVPRTPDGRVIFAIPWHGRTMIGSTDTPVPTAPLEPCPLPAEIDFLLQTVAPYLAQKPRASDIRSTWAGVRPLFASSKTASTAKLGRDHVIQVSPSGLLSIMGGKWTTYRKMAEDCVDRAAEIGGLAKCVCRTSDLPIHGAMAAPAIDRSLAQYGSDAQGVHELLAENDAWRKPLAAGFPYSLGEVVWAARHEMARTVEDVVARRTRLLFLDATAALAAAPRVAALLAIELGRDSAWEAEQLRTFRELAGGYFPGGVSPT